MSSREELHEILCEKLGSRNVYYQPPSSIKMKYDAIKYSKTKITTKYANNKKYMMNDSYEVIVISRRADNPVVKSLLELDYCSYVRPYVSDGLHHDVLTLYY